MVAQPGVALRHRSWRNTEQAAISRTIVLMSRHKEIRTPLGIILPLDEVKRRVIIDALDKYKESYLMATAY
jgi:hypothetical protein